MKISQLSFMLSIILICLAVPAWAQQYEFKAEGDSQQINLPDNQGTVNINQYHKYLLKSDDYSALTQQLDKLDKDLLEKQQDCAAFEAVGNTERLTKCRQGYAQWQDERDSVAQIIVQFKEDVLHLAQTFERIPLKSERLRLAKELFDAGKFREVHAIMNTQEMTQEGEALLAQKERFQSGLQETDSMLRIKAEEFVVKAQVEAVDYTDTKRIDSTALCYLQALRYNNNPQTLLDLAIFFSHNHLYDSALVYFPKVIAHPKVEDWQVANAYGNMGKVHAATRELPAALDAYTLCFKRYKTLHQREPEDSFYKGNLAISYSKLGETYIALGNSLKALTFFEDYNRLEKELRDAYPQNVDFKNGLAISYSKLGETLSALDSLTQALTFFEQFNRLEKELYEAYPQNVSFKNGLAISYLYLGNTHSALGYSSQDLAFFEEFNRLEKELHEAYPQHVDFKNGLAISYEKLGETHTALGNLPQALIFFEEETTLFEELYEAYPQNVSFKKGLAISYEKLGSTHSALGHLPQALIFFEKNIELSKELHEAYPQDAEFKNGLAISYYQLGAFARDQLNDAPKAIAYFEEVEKLVAEMVNDAPAYPLYKSQLARIQREIGALEQPSDPIYQLMQRIANEPAPLVQYQLYTELCDTLRHRVAQDPAQKLALADALNSRAWTGFFLKKFAAVEADVREGLALQTENKYLPSNLAPALLLQGKQREAMQEYNRWKDKPFGEQGYPTYREAFIDDLNTFEKAGIIPPEVMRGVRAVRKLMAE